jgi:hypothetical protein
MMTKFKSFAACLTIGMTAACTHVAEAPALSPVQPDGEHFQLLRIYAGEDGKSQGAIFDLPRTAGEPGSSVITRLYATDVEIGDAEPGMFIDWHGVSTPRLLVLLSGKLEVGLGDGSKHVMNKGDIVLAADTTGQGHTSRTFGDEPVRIMTVRLPREDSFRAKLSSCPDGVPVEECVAAQLQIK